ncbi:glyoxalase [Bradyrhizobium sp. F1.13.3]|uniref:glyoxalase n=1 Tax=Bradyrhizobium sp. F1.13.3 TaxID=3156351 RepID=UPI00339709EC
MKTTSALVLFAFAAAAVASGPAAAKDTTKSKETAVAVAPQYDTTHVYVAPDDVDKFVSTFLATFGGKSTKQVVATVTPTPSSTTSQLLQTPVGTVSLFGFKTPVPYPFGAERNGYLVSDLDEAVKSARAAGADVIVSTFPDPIGRDAVIQWPGGVNLQIYWHTTKPDYAAFERIPENRVYVSPDRAAAFIKSFVAFSRGKVVSDDAKTAGVEIGRPDATYRRVRIESAFGKMVVLVTDGHLPYPYGRETTGYEVADLAATLGKAKDAGATVLVDPYTSDGRSTAFLMFPGGYVAEIHSPSAKSASRADGK